VHGAFMPHELWQAAGMARQQPFALRLELSAAASAAGLVELVELDARVLIPRGADRSPDPIVLILAMFPVCGSDCIRSTRQRLARESVVVDDRGQPYPLSTPGACLSCVLNPKHDKALSRVRAHARSLRMAVSTGEQ